jgi:hypothetical protein
VALSIHICADCKRKTRAFESLVHLSEAGLRFFSCRLRSQSKRFLAEESVQLAGIFGISCGIDVEHLPYAGGPRPTYSKFELLYTVDEQTFRVIAQWPRGLRRGFAAARLLGLRVRIPPGAWMCVSCECCLWSGEVCATGRSLVESSSTECGVFKADITRGYFT